MKVKKKKVKKVQLYKWIITNQINNHLHYKQDLEEIQEINNKDYKF